jgi:uncharacterized protein (TIGR02452 family)
MEKEKLIDIWNETVDIVSEGRYFSVGDVIVDNKKVVQNSLFFEFEDIQYINTETKITIIDADCLEQAKLLEKPLVLNMASYKTPGGGVINGSSAQEENLFRRTNLFRSLYSLRDKYPLPLYGGIYSKDITVFRESEEKGYGIMDNPFEISVISIAAVKRPELIDNRMSDSDLFIMRNKIKTIFEMAFAKKHENLVLSAFGCGSYGNPPEQIAKLFKDVLDNDFKGIFRHIVFAIFDDHNSYREHNPNGNLKPFKDVFEKR